jgi:predicted O-linked N-acetylglucosamine transferase (SPINDLY family)
MASTAQLRAAAAAHLAAGRLNEAAAAYGEVLARAPKDFEAHHQLGTLRLQLGNSAEGFSLLAAASRLNPTHAETWLHLGMAAQNLGQFEEAVAHYRQSLALKPDDAAPLFRLGVLLRHLRRQNDALTAFDRCIALMPDEETPLQQRGELKFEMQDFGGALADFDAMLAHNPGAVQALLYRGVALSYLERPAEALAALDRAVALAPERAEIFFNRGVVLEALGHSGEALSAYDTAIRLTPGHADAWNNRGGVLRGQGRLEEAADSFRRAIALAPRHLPALINRGTVLAILNRNAAAAADFRRVLEIEPGNATAQGALLSALLPLCDWAGIEALKPRLAAGVREGSSNVSPFQMTLAFDDPKLLHDCSVPFLKKLVPVTPAPRPSPWPTDGRIRLAYVSADFQTHATAVLISDLIERHDRQRFEVIGLSYGADDGKSERARLARGFDRFLDMHNRTDAQMAEMLRALQTDIAVDLKGYTLWARPGIFARGPAPVTVSWLGYPGSMAVDWYDYVLADPVVLPHDQQPFYDEKIVHLPDCYQSNDPARPLATMTRAAAGLPENGFVFCCFNIHRKISRPVFESWMRLLAAVPGSLLWLMDDTANDVLRAEAAARGLDPARLIFAPKLEMTAHLARIAAAGLMLDTMPYGAHTTGSDALWAGVPLITVLGTSFANRVAASLVTAIGMPELIAPSLEAYEALALAIARDPARLAALKTKLAAKRLTAPLFDAERFRRHIERAYETMMERARAGQAPQPFDVPILKASS